MKRLTATYHARSVFIMDVPCLWPCTLTRQYEDRKVEKNRKKMARQKKKEGRVSGLRAAMRFQAFFEEVETYKSKLGGKTWYPVLSYMAMNKIVSTRFLEKSFLSL